LKKLIDETYPNMNMTPGFIMKIGPLTAAMAEAKFKTMKKDDNPALYKKVEANIKFLKK
jgi:hypothetical protein